MKTAIVLFVLTLTGAAQANETTCEAYANLHWEMAESAGIDGDSAWENAYERCEAFGAESVRIDSEVE